MNKKVLRLADSIGRRSFIGGSDARTIMGADEAALQRLWREKRGETERKTCRAIFSSTSDWRPNI